MNLKHRGCGSGDCNTFDCYEEKYYGHVILSIRDVYAFRMGFGDI